jgi:hypothetical protein
VRTGAREVGRVAKRGKRILVDGSNVACDEVSNGGKPKVSNIVAMRKALVEEGFDPLIIVDASLKHHIDDKEQLEALIELQEVREVPASTDADYFIIEYAEDDEAQIVTNDRFKDYQRKHRGLRDRLVPYMIVEGRVRLYERRLEEAK